MATDITYHPSPLVPSEWMVVCPLCGDTTGVNVREDDAGAICPEGDERFIRCEGCSGHIEVRPVSVSDLPDDYEVFDKNTW